MIGASWRRALLLMLTVCMTLQGRIEPSILLCILLLPILTLIIVPCKRANKYSTSAKSLWLIKSSSKLESSAQIMDSIYEEKYSGEQSQYFILILEISQCIFLFLSTFQYTSLYNLFLILLFFLTLL